jgi:hypothetical protein
MTQSTCHVAAIAAFDMKYSKIVALERQMGYPHHDDEVTGAVRMEF